MNQTAGVAEGEQKGVSSWEIERCKKTIV